MSDVRSYIDKRYSLSKILIRQTGSLNIFIIKDALDKVRKLRKGLRKKDMKRYRDNT